MMRIFTLLFSLVFLTCASLKADELVMQVEPRWGAQIGDMIQAEILLPFPSSALDRSALPLRDQRIGNWLHLRSVDLHADRVVLLLQIVNVPAAMQTIEMPVFSLRSTLGDFYTTAPTSVVIGSLLPLEIPEVQAEMMQPDALAEPIDVSSLIRNIQWSVLAAIILAALLFLWHWGLRPRQRLPFAQVMLRLYWLMLRRKLDAETAARLVHHALNYTAGRVLVQRDLACLYEHAPWLAPLATEIDAFFTQSGAFFYGENSAALPTAAELIQFAKRLRARERLA